jgi:hypothetical protein
MLVHFSVIAVPGLGSHAIGAWKARDSHKVWLRDFLPQDIPNIRVLVYGYDTKLSGNDSKQSIADLGNNFLESVKSFREVLCARLGNMRYYSLRPDRQVAVDRSYLLDTV